MINIYIPLVAQLKNAVINVYSENAEKLFYHELINLCEETLSKITITEEEVDLIENHTKSQSKSNLWFKARAGVITASNFKSCCTSNLAMPSKNLIMKICYPMKNTFTSEATAYGCKNESAAREYLTVYLANEHENLVVTDCGLYRSTVFPYLGATPDGLVKCSCCPHDYIIEIKCPFKCLKVCPTELALNDKEFCMEYNHSDQKFYLKRKHAYYYQVQLQMLLTNTPSCYFIVYSHTTSLVELINVDMTFLTENVAKALRFYKLAILPELVGKWYSRDHVPCPHIESIALENNSEICCTCGESKQGDTVVCSDKACVISRYHLICLGLVDKPQGKWFCPYCSRKKTRGKKRKL